MVRQHLPTFREICARQASRSASALIRKAVLTISLAEAYPDRANLLQKIRGIAISQLLWISYAHPLFFKPPRFQRSHPRKSLAIVRGREERR
jgi:hypothetical protein